ncbi:uncharacterized protein LOC107178502 [Citrus sinensis]|uniref:uncharacterized protein LOC107178502 n=1 Tax=Citrus sinensis TaxID=2711 RepID=UPI002277DA45|nr:uncharacterized protein LOC107178502 [Citrus sinensis]
MSWLELEAHALSHLTQGEMAQTREPNACLEPSQNHDNEILNQTVENSSRTKRRKLTSKVWDEFTKFQGKNGKVWAKCRDCNGEGRGGDRSPRTHPRYFAYVPVPSPSPSELLERIPIPSPNNNRGSPRVPDPQITNTFFFNFELIIY